MSIGISAALGAEVERLRAELAEAKRDADTLKWFRANWQAGVYIKIGDKYIHAPTCQGCGRMLPAIDWSAIDAAMAGGEHG